MRKNLLADAYEQIGYQAESGPWRSVYLQGAFELRNGVPKAGGINTASPDTIKAMPPEMTFEYFAVRLNGENAAGKKIALNVEFTDLKKPVLAVIENGVLNYAQKLVDKADAKITLTKTTLDSHPAQGDKPSSRPSPRATSRSRAAAKRSRSS